jgi:hypothetical protein
MAVPEEFNFFSRWLKKLVNSYWLFGIGFWSLAAGPRFLAAGLWLG